MDYDRYLILYSGGEDSTYFIERETSARHLVFFKGRNDQQAKVAISNANILNRFLTVVSRSEGPGSHSGDGETNNIHALYDTLMVLDACSMAVSFGMLGVVTCFNADDIGIDTEAVRSIMRRVDPAFEVLEPLRSMSANEIRASRTESALRSVSCMNDEKCGYCAKCKRGH